MGDDIHFVHDVLSFHTLMTLVPCYTSLPMLGARQPFASVHAGKLRGVVGLA